MDANDWLAGELALLEARLQGQGPTCQLDRQRASPAALKADEGRYAVLRRAARLLARGETLAPLLAEADKARAFLAADSALARDRAWQAHYTAVLAAVEELRQRLPF